MSLSDKQIDEAKAEANLPSPRHEHNDCIRMCYEWLSAQKTTKSKRQADWKHFVEDWCGRYVTEDDIKVAALLHPDIERDGAKLNISKRLVLPSFERLSGTGEAKKHRARMDEDYKRIYASREG